MKGYSIVLIAVVTLIVSLVFYQPLAPVVTTAATFVAGFVVFFFAALAFALSWIFVEKARLSRARRIEAEKQAHVLTITENGETWVRDTHPKATWRNLTGTPALYVNGQSHEPTDLEIDLYRYRLAMSQKSPRIINGAAELLPPQTQPVDLLAALDSVQRCLIVGASDSGKTTLLQHVITRRLQTSKVVVIDPHAYPGKFPTGCKVVGAGRNYSEIDNALTALVQLMTKRYDEIGRGIVRELGHARITILIDEWRAIVFNVKEAADCIKALLTESRKAAFSVFVATHSERVKALGIEGEGDLKDGFAIVRLSVAAGGERVATIDAGSREQPTKLPGPYIQPAPVVEHDDSIDLEVEPTPTEAAIITLYRQGESKRSICEKVYGYVSSNKYPEIEAVLTKFGAK